MSKAVIIIVIRLRYDYDVIDVVANGEPKSQLRFDRLRYDYDKTTTKNWHVNFLLASNRVEWKQARATRRSRIVVVA